MKINKIFNNIQKRIDITKYNKHQKEINELVNTSRMKMDSDAYNQIDMARETIANFARKNCVNVDIYDTSETMAFAKQINPEIEKTLGDNITIRVTDMLNGKSKEVMMPADTSKEYVFERKNSRMLHNTDSGTEYIYQGHFTSEDNFLKTVYRHISNLTSAIKGKKS